MAEDVPSPEEIILYEKDPETRIATITLNRPDHLNAPTIGARKRYGDLIFKASLDDDVKVLVVRGVGDHLGTGADLDELMAKRKGGVAMQEEFGITDEDDVTMPGRNNYRNGASLVHWYADPRSGNRSLADFKKISILEVKGYCYGWHFYQAADADLAGALVDVHDGDVRPEREGEVGRVVVVDRLESRLHALRVVRVRRERDLLDRLEPVRAALDAELPVGPLEVVGRRLEQVRREEPCLVADLARRDRGGGARHRGRA